MPTDPAAPHLALVGPTASGKSALAVEVARRLGGPAIEIVSADSMQVYRGMDVGTAKPSPAERDEVAHHLVDIADPEDDFSLARFQAAARAAIASIEARGHRALLVGGTGLYVRAVVDDLDVPGVYPEVRAELEADPDDAGLHRRLAQLDALAASRMTPANRRRIVRALEVTIGSGRPFSSYGPGLATHTPTPFRMAGVWIARRALAPRIEARVRAMFEGGLLEEVRALSGRPLSRTARQALGYKELLAHLEGRWTLDEARAVIESRTRAFARRQRVWFRRDPRIWWYACDGDPFGVVPALLGDWERPCPS